MHCVLGDAPGGPPPGAGHVIVNLAMTEPSDPLSAPLPEPGSEPMTAVSSSGPDPETRCPCGSGDTYGRCCRPLHRGRAAATAEALMRSRFSAFVLGDEGHLLRTWHPDTRPGSIDLDPDLRWHRLEINAATGGGPFEEWGTVDFTAHYRPRPGTRGLKGAQRENSRFRRVDGRWLYLDGALLSV